MNESLVADAILITAREIDRETMLNNLNFRFIRSRLHDIIVELLRSAMHEDASGSKASDAVSFQRHNYVMAHFNSLEAGACTAPRLGVISRCDLASQRKSPLSMPANGNALIPEPPLPHAGEAVFHAVDLPESHLLAPLSFDHDQRARSKFRSETPAFDARRTHSGK